MNPVHIPPQPPAAPPACAPAPRRSLPLGVVVLLLALTAALLGAGSAAALERVLGLAATWAALGGALLGTLVAVLPMVALAMKRSPASGPSPEPGSAFGAVSAVTPRALFFQLAEREWSRARRYNTGAALLLVDVDRYLRLCEVRGGEAGVAVLSELLRTTAANLRGADVVTRLADGQMAVFLAQADATGALDVAERVRERAERLGLSWAGQQLRITVSVGVAHLRAVHPHLQSLIEDAKDALAAARQAGGNCVRAAPQEPGRVRRAGSWSADRRTPRRQPRP
jgi:diguanylate cyclase (GGDEF)-like protein